MAPFQKRRACACTGTCTSNLFCTYMSTSPALQGPHLQLEPSFIWQIAAFEVPVGHPPFCGWQRFWGIGEGGRRLATQSCFSSDDSHHLHCLTANPK